MKIIKDRIKKILCIKPRGIGDVVLSTIVIDNLKQHFPSATIDYLTEPFITPALQYNPNINKVITMGKSEFSLKVAFRIKKEKYDLILDLWSNPRSAQITFLSGVKYRVGFAYRGRKYAYNILATSGRGREHAAEHNLELLKALNVPVISKNIQYFVSKEDDNFGKDFIENNFSKGKKIVGIIPAGGWESKRCDAIKWVEICKAISDKYRSNFLILWGPGDEKDSQSIKNSIPDLAVLAPETTLQQMSGLIKNCHLVLANDSGPMHISAALGIPTLGIFGPTSPYGHRPYSQSSDYIHKEDLFCLMCNKLICPYKHECMLQLPVENVMEKVKKIAGNVMK
jgi:lipopolysaccharide heptosyltransferase II